MKKTNETELKEIKKMTVKELNTEKDELGVYMSPDAIIVSYDTFNWNGLDYWGVKRRFDDIVNELETRK